MSDCQREWVGNPWVQRGIVIRSVKTVNETSLHLERLKSPQDFDVCKYKKLLSPILSTCHLFPLVVVFCLSKTPLLNWGEVLLLWSLQSYHKFSGLSLTVWPPRSVRTHFVEVFNIYSEENRCAELKLRKRSYLTIPYLLGLKANFCFRTIYETNCHFISALLLRPQKKILGH